jgi:glycosyltransferase involved in cell wall biosynthesis
LVRTALRPLRILIDATKISEGHFDGCYCYTVELIRALRARYGDDPAVRIDLAIGTKPVSIAALERLIGSNQKRSAHLERTAINRVASLRQAIADWLRASANSTLVEMLRRIDKSTGVTQRLEVRHRGRCPILPGYDVVHLTLPQDYRLMNWRCRPPLVTTIHDCTHRRFPHFHTAHNAQETERGIQFSLEANALFVANSEATRSDFIDTYHVPSERVITTQLAVSPKRCRPIQDPRQIADALRRYGAPQRPYFLALSTLEPRKNLSGAIQAFVRLKSMTEAKDVQLIIAGRPGWQYRDILESGRSRDVRFTGFVADADLAALYSGAIGLVFPSHFEGFGLPALEAMTCGAPVVYGDCGSLPETVGDAGLPADPNSTDSILESMRLLLVDPDLRRKLSENAVRRAGMFSWDTTAEKTMQAYQMAAATDSSSEASARPAHLIRKEEPRNAGDSKDSATHPYNG